MNRTIGHLQPQKIPKLVFEVLIGLRFTFLYLRIFLSMYKILSLKGC